MERLILLGVPFTVADGDAMPRLRELASDDTVSEPVRALLSERGVRFIEQLSQGFWAQSVAEFALALTICALRRIPQTHHAIITDQAPWNYEPEGGVGRPGGRGIQFGDDLRFVNGTVSGKRVRIVGAGNIASRYAQFVHTLGAEVAAWDPFAGEPCFHRTGARREWHLDRFNARRAYIRPYAPLNRKNAGFDHRRAYRQFAERMPCGAGDASRNLRYVRATAARVSRRDFARRRCVRRRTGIA